MKTTQEQCANPNQIEKWELEAVHDGEDIPHVHSHLANCPACQADLESWRREDAILAKKLYRFDCPPTDTLRDFYWDDLPKTMQRLVRSHLMECHLCTEEVQRITDFVGQPAESPVVSALTAISAKTQEIVDTFTEDVRLVIASLVTPAQPAMAAAFRGESDVKALTFDANDLIISLMMTKQGDGYSVDGQVLTPEPGLEAHYQIISQQKDEKSVEGSVDQTGSFSVPGLDEGIYQLVIRMGGQAVVVPEFTI